MEIEENFVIIFKNDTTPAIWTRIETILKSYNSILVERVEYDIWNECYYYVDDGQLNDLFITFNELVKNFNPQIKDFNIRIECV